MFPCSWFGCPYQCRAKAHLCNDVFYVAGTLNPTHSLSAASTAWVCKLLLLLLWHCYKVICFTLHTMWSIKTRSSELLTESLLISIRLAVFKPGWSIHTFLSQACWWFCRRSKSSSHSPRPPVARRNENSSSTVIGDSRSRHDKDRGADARILARHASAADIRKYSPSSSDTRRSKKAVRATSPFRQRSSSVSPEFSSTKHKRSKLVSPPVVLSKSHKHNGRRRHGQSRSKERHVHSGADRRRWSVQWY